MTKEAVLSLTGTDSKVKAFLTTLRKEILADQPIRQNIRNWRKAE